MLKYKDFIASGVYNKVFNLDDNWVLKMPLNRINNDEFNNQREVLKKFNDHIKIMKKYPDLFPEVKKLDPNRAAIEKCDTVTAKKEIEHIYYYLYDTFTFNKRVAMEDFLEYIMFQDKHYLKLLKDGDDICKRWSVFLNKILNSKLRTSEYFDLDIHFDNFGIDKKGNIKLIDF